jgi:hypothetical protein
MSDEAMPKKTKPKPKAEQPKPTAKVNEHPPLGYSGRGYITSELDRRLHNAMCERGEVLTIDTSGPSYTVHRAVDNVQILTGQTLTQIKTRARSVDPSIV